jgi:RND superfamily putative drug exporter
MRRSPADTSRRLSRPQLALVVLTVALLASMAVILPGLPARLDPGGWIPADSESIAVDSQLASRFDRRATSHVILLTPARAGLSLDSAEARREVGRITRELRGVPGVTAVYTPLGAPTAAMRDALVSEDGRAWLVVAQMQDELQTAIGHLSDIESALHSNLLDARVTGVPALSAAFGERVKADLFRAELIALPIALLLLIRFAGGWRPALAIVITTLTALAGSVLLIGAASPAIPVSVFALSTVAMLTIALSLDFGLLAVLRRTGHHVDRHVRATLRTGAIAVIAGVAGLALLPIDATRSIGLAGVAAVAVVLACHLYLLPAWLRILRADVSRRDQAPPAPSRWLGWVSRHPFTSLLVGIALLAPLLAPLARIDVTGPGPTLLPGSSTAARTLSDVQTAFPTVPIAPIHIIASPTGGTMYDASNLLSLKQTADRIARLPGVASVRTVWDLVPGGITSPVLTASLALDPTLAQQARPLLTATGAVIEIVPETGAGEHLVDLIRAEAGRLSDGDLRLLVGGADAAGVDLVSKIEEIALPALALVAVATVVVLAVAWRSVVLPLKAVALNALPVLAGLGAVTWLFQLGAPWTDGQGTTTILIPMVLTWLMFGISMDYEVFMVGRIREYRERGWPDREATAMGIEAARAVVSRGAVLMGIVFLAFAASDVHVVRAIGVGLLVAVVVDATVVRLVLLPATMTLLGRANWWWPEWLPARPVEPALVAETVQTGNRR